MARTSKDGGANRLDITVEENGPATIMHLAGDVDLNVSPVLRKRLKELTGAKKQKIVINLADVPYIDSSGVATLVECLQGVSRYDGKLHLAAMVQQTRSVFEISRLDTVFSIYTSLQEALEA